MARRSPQFSWKLFNLSKTQSTTHRQCDETLPPP